MIPAYVIPGVLFIRGSRSNEQVMLHISKMVADELGIEHKRLFNKSRKKELVEGRQISIYLIKKHNRNITHQVVGEFFGRDHTCIVHSLQRIQDLMDTEEKLKNLVMSLDYKL